MRRSSRAPSPFLLLPRMAAAATTVLLFSAQAHASSSDIPNERTTRIIVNTGNERRSALLPRIHPWRKLKRPNHWQQPRQQNRVVIDFCAKSTASSAKTRDALPNGGDSSDDALGEWDLHQSQHHEESEAPYPPVDAAATSKISKKDDGPAVSAACDERGRVTVALDGEGLKKLLTALPGLSSDIIVRFAATLRVLVLLILGRRLLNGLVYIFKDIVLYLPVDYLTGYYLRKTFTRLERAYLRYYELPSVMRAIARTLAQITFLFVLAGVVGWVYGMSGPPCREEGKGLSLICSTLWMAVVVAAGRACSSAIAVWGGPLRVEVASHPKNKKVFTRPSHFVEWITDMEELRSIFSHDTAKAFDPNPLIFPASWVPLKVLLTFAVAKALATDPASCKWCASEANQVPILMKQYLIQHALGDEWYKVLLIEKRVGLGIIFISAHFLGLVNLIVNTASINGAATSLMIPSLVSVIVSGWMNVVIFITRLNLNKREKAAKALERRKRAALGAFRLGDSYYN